MNSVTYLRIAAPQPTNAGLAGDDQIDHRR
jgi:hypothetical protein